MIRVVRSDTAPRPSPSLPGDSDRVAATPEHEREDQVDDDDGDDAEANRPSDGDADAFGPARRVEAVIAVDHRDGDGEDARLRQAVDDVDEGQVQVEVVVVDAR